jgi:hypothetical protein
MDQCEEHVGCCFFNKRESEKNKENIGLLRDDSNCSVWSLKI